VLSALAAFMPSLRHALDSARCPHRVSAPWPAVLSGRLFRYVARLWGRRSLLQGVAWRWVSSCGVRRLTRALVCSAQGVFGPSTAGSKRFLNLHEYQSKDLLDKFGVNTQKGRVASTPEEALEISKWILNDSTSRHSWAVSRQRVDSEAVVPCALCLQTPRPSLS